MRRLLGPAAAVAGAVVLGLAAAFLWRSATDDARAPERAATQVVVLTRVEPRVHGLGDRITAELVVVLDTGVVDPKTVRPLVDYEPYDRIAPVERIVKQSGSVARLTYRYPLLCIAEACAPAEGTQSTKLPTGTVHFRFRDAPRPVSREFDWPEMTFVTRATENEVDGALWRVDSPAIRPASFRFSPGRLAAVLFGGALAFLLLAAGIAWQFVDLRRRQPEEEVVADTRSPLERALDAARLASLDGAVPERRRALERVARELAALGEPGLAARARTLAWSREGASRQAVEDLARDARQATDVGEEEVA